MFELLKTNWEIILGVSGVIASPIAWVFGGRQSKNIEIKKASTDAISSMQSIYDSFLQDYRDRMGEVVIELQTVKASNTELQKQFNELHLQYAKEVERSQSWEKLHNELKHRYDDLIKIYEALQKDHDKLKKDFDLHKKNNK